MTPSTHAETQQPPSHDSRPQLWNFWQALITSLLTALTTILVTYMTVVKPGAEDAATRSAREETERKYRELAVPVTINPDGVVRPNDSEQRLLVFGFCNATMDQKVIEAWTGAAAEKQALVASESGTDRLGITFLVPPRWYYRVTYTEVAGIGCTFSGSRF